MNRCVILKRCPVDTGVQDLSVNVILKDISELNYYGLKPNFVMLSIHGLKPVVIHHPLLRPEGLGLRRASIIHSFNLRPNASV